MDAAIITTMTGHKNMYVKVGYVPKMGGSQTVNKLDAMSFSVEKGHVAPPPSSSSRVYTVWSRSSFHSQPAQTREYS